MTDEQYIQEAISEALDGIHEGDGGPFGTVIVKDGHIIARGHNRVLVDHDPTAHGEMVALRIAGKNLGTHDLTGCTLYTSAEPCPMCASAIAWANVRRVVYACTAKDTADHLGFRDDRLYEMLRKGQPLTPSDHVTVSNMMEPFDEYARMEGLIY